MKKYLFGLEAMLIGAGLMFVFTHTEVSAESEADFDFICTFQSAALLGTETKKYSELKNLITWECKKGNITCYTSTDGISCFNTGLFK